MLAVPTNGLLIFDSPNIAPEILDETPDVNPALADLYSFGMHGYLQHYPRACINSFLSIRNNTVGAGYKKTTLSWNEVPTQSIKFCT